MNAALTSTSLTVIALVLRSVTTMGAGAVPGTEDTASSPSAAPPSRSLDGMTFAAQSREKGNQASNKGTNVFRNGRFLSEGCNPYGFGNAPYQATVEAPRSASTSRPTARHTATWSGPGSSGATPSKQRTHGPACAGTGTSRESNWYRGAT